MAPTKIPAPRTFSRFTAARRERLSTGRGVGAVVMVGSKPFAVVAKLISDRGSRWREEPTAAAAKEVVPRDYGEYRPLTDYRLIKVESSGRPGWYVYLCSRPNEQGIARLTRAVRERYAAADDPGMPGTVVRPGSLIRRRPPAARSGRGGTTRAHSVTSGTW